MPASQELRRDFRDKDVVFVYLSIDDEADRWRQAAGEEGLAAYRHNYRVLNRRRSRLLEDLAVQSIPRYLLYDRQGELLYRQAPSPGAEARRMLEQ